MSEFWSQLQLVFSEFGSQIIRAAPIVTMAVVVGLLGIFSAWVVERTLVALVRGKRIESLLARAGFPRWLKRAGVERDGARFLGRVGFWVVLLMLVRTAAYVFDLEPISQAIGTFLGYLPQLFAAVAILLLGGMLARGAAAMVKRGAVGAGSDVATSLGAIVYGLIMYAIAIMALSQMGIDTQVVRVFSVVVLSSIGLAFSLAFGLGARTAFENVIAGYHVRRSFGVGETLRLPEGSGTIERVTATQTFLKLDSGDFALPSSELLSRTKFCGTGSTQN